MPFESALRELAEACHSRAWVDLAVEREARERLHDASERAKTLAGDVERGETTTSEALQQLAQQVCPETETRLPARTPLADTHTLEGLGAEVENAVNVEQASQTLEARLWSSETYVMELESCVDEETSLPGVPCPQCGTGHLVHWPVWF
jgi:hypothetical protein